MKGASLVTVSFVALASAAVCAAQVPAGPEFRVNTYTTGPQYQGGVAVESDGDFLVTWSSKGLDGSESAVACQRFDAAGTRRGGEFVLNSYTTGGQGVPMAAVRRSGAFVVVWQDALWADRGIHARHFDKLGHPIGAEFQVNTHTTGFQVSVRVAGSESTQFVVTWANQGADGSGWGIAARPFLASFEPAGPELVVNSYTTGEQGSPRVAAERLSGDFVVVWQDYGRDGSRAGIFGRRFTAAGIPIGGDFPVNTYTTGDQSGPSVSVAPGGRFVVAWSSQGLDGDSWGVVARRYEANGVPIGSEFTVNSYTTGIQTSAYEAISHDLTGSFVIVWDSNAPGGLGRRLFGQRFNADGSRRGAEFAVNTYTTGFNLGGTVRSDAIGNFVVTWQDLNGRDGDGDGVFGRRFGGLFPRGLRVDTPGNGVIEAGETVVVRPTWSNTTDSAQEFSGTFAWTSGPGGPQPTVLDGVASYGIVPATSDVECADCYTVSFPAAPRPTLDWDVQFLESLAPDVQGQRQPWSLHIGGSFSDVPAASPFYRFVETMVHYNVTTGCTATEYCPASSTTRAQMAVFLLAANEGNGWVPPACGATPMFADVPVSSPFCRWVEEAARRGVTGGCGGGNYCPTSPLSREQMAVLVLRTLDPALNPAPCGTPMFSDVPATSPFCRWIEELARRGVVSGCGGGAYCPALPVSRQEMSVFLAVTFDLKLYGAAILR